MLGDLYLDVHWELFDTAFAHALGHLLTLETGTVCVVAGLRRNFSQLLSSLHKLFRNRISLVQRTCIGFGST